MYNITTYSIPLPLQIEKTTIMARPIRETPILTGEDAEHFVKEMERVDAIPPEVRAAYQEKLERQFEEISKKIKFCI